MQEQHVRVARQLDQQDAMDAGPEPASREAAVKQNRSTQQGKTRDTAMVRGG